MVDVTREPEDLGGPPYESCCKCEKSTPFWYVPLDVPLCLKCSEDTDEKDIPTKKEWMDK